MPKPQPLFHCPDHEDQYFKIGLFGNVTLLFQFIGFVHCYPCTFSLMMLRERMHRLLNFCSPAAVPTEWKEQLVTVGKTVHCKAIVITRLLSCVSLPVG